jgi:hypothetical protein
MGWQDDSTITVTIPTVFLDNRGGGIFFTLAPESNASFLPPREAEGPLATASVTYLPLDGAPDRDSIGIAMDQKGPSRGMALGALLIDEFTVLHEATSAHYLRNDQEAAFGLVDAFRDRLEASRLPGLDGERELIGALHERISFLSGHGGEPVSHLGKLWGRWKVVGGDEEADLSPGEIMEFTADNKIRMYDSEGNLTEDETEYECNDTQIHLPDEEILLKYRLRGDKLSLREMQSGIKLQLIRATKG